MEAWLADANARSQQALPTAVHSAASSTNSQHALCCCWFHPTPNMLCVAAGSAPLPACSALLPLLPHSQYVLQTSMLRHTHYLVYGAPQPLSLGLRLLWVCGLPLRPRQAPTLLPKNGDRPHLFKASQHQVVSSPMRKALLSPCLLTLVSTSKRSLQ